MYIRGSRYLPTPTCIPLPNTCSKNSTAIIIFSVSIFQFSLHFIVLFDGIYICMSIIQIVHILHSLISLCQRYTVTKPWRRVCVYPQNITTCFQIWVVTVVQPLLNTRHLVFLYRAQTPGVYQTYCSAFIDKYHCHQILCSQLQGA